MKQIHVSINGNDVTGLGTIDNPFRNIQYALNYVEPGSTVLIHSGTYEPFVINKEASGSQEKKVTIKSADEQKAVIKGLPGEFSITVHMVNVENITLDGLEVIGGGLGIYCISDNTIGDKTLENITITNCVVHGIRGMHGIAVYAKNDLAPIKNLVMSNCEVYDCRLDSSESTVFNGNIDGFTICNNVIHDNNNIGIDMIGFEGKAKHNDGSYSNEYDVDFVRNGKCYDNFVYNISAFDNEAYFENPLASIKEDTTGEYNLCANGIYVDGGQDIEIFNNFMYNCDIGLEVATEHSPDDNPIFKVSGVDVHDNVVCLCAGNSGLAFGGYDYNLGFTENCNFSNNTFIDNNAAMLIQRSSNNNILNNIVADGDLAFLFNHEVKINDQVNNFKNNVFCTNKKINDYFDLAGKDIDYLMNRSLNEQIFESDRNKVLDDCISLLDNVGSRFNPNKKQLDSYHDYLNIGLFGIEKTEEFINDNLAYVNISDVLQKNKNICSYLNDILKNNGLDKASLELIKCKDSDLLCNERNEENGNIDVSKLNSMNDIIHPEFHLRYEYDLNSFAHKWIKAITIKK